SGEACGRRGGGLRGPGCRGREGGHLEFVHVLLERFRGEPDGLAVVRRTRLPASTPAPRQPLLPLEGAPLAALSLPLAHRDSSSRPPRRPARMPPRGRDP